MQSYNFILVIRKPTRFSTSTSVLLDHVLVDSLNVDRAGILDYDITDHYPVFVTFPNQILKNSCFLKTISFRDYNGGNIDLFKSKISTFKFEFELFEDVNYKILYFHNTWKFLIMTLAQSKVQNQNNNYKKFERPWI